MQPLIQLHLFLSVVQLPLHRYFSSANILHGINAEVEAFERVKFLLFCRTILVVFIVFMSVREEFGFCPHCFYLLNEYR